MKDRMIKNGRGKLLLPALLWIVAAAATPGASTDKALLHSQHMTPDETIVSNGNQAMESMKQEMLHQLRKDLARQFQEMVNRFFDIMIDFGTSRPSK